MIRQRKAPSGLRGTVPFLRLLTCVSSPRKTPQTAAFSHRAARSYRERTEARAATYAAHFGALHSFLLLTPFSTHTSHLSKAHFLCRPIEADIVAAGTFRKRPPPLRRVDTLP
jgi:hypothetical protein